MSLGFKEVIEQSEVLKKQQNLIKWVFNSLIVSIFLNVALCGIIIAMLPLKETKPYLMFFSNAEQNFVRVLPVGESIQGEKALIKTLLASYVSKRETINRIDDGFRYKDIKEQSSSAVWDAFYKLIAQKNSIFQNESIKREVIIKNVANLTKSIAQVDFVVKLIKDNAIESVKAYRATMEYTFDTQIIKSSDVPNNPLGFIVTAYAISEINENFINSNENIKMREE